jgi:serine protease inhibitor
MSTRIYAVQSADEEFRLVRATTKQAALRFVAERRYSIDVANQDTLVGAMEAGVKVEDATAVPTTMETAEEAATPA